MALTFDVEELFVLALVAAGFVPVVRAYAGNRESRLLLAGYGALLFGRVATVAEDVVFPVALAVLEHAVGVGLAGLLFCAHFYFLAQRVPADEPRPTERPATGDRGGDD